MARKPRVAPLTQTQKLQQNRMARKGVVIAEGVHLDETVESWYRRQLEAYLRAMRADVEATLFKQLKVDEDLYAKDSMATRDSFVDIFGATLSGLVDRWTITDQFARALAAQFVGRMNDKTKKRIERSVGKAMGVDIAQLVAGEGLGEAMDASIRENVRLIKSIPEYYLADIQRIIDTETIKGRSGSSIIEQIQKVYPVSERKARLIARDQSNKVNGDLTRVRQTSSGIRAYRWRTVGDNAVRESHKERNGKVFAWNPADVGKRLDSGEVMLDPTKDDVGHPGEDIQCRCIAEPIIELDLII